MDYTKEMLLSAAENASALAPEVVASVFRDFADALEKLKVAEEALDSLLMLWPSQKILESLEPDDRSISRSAPLGRLPKVVDITRYRAALARIRGANA